MHTVHDTPAAEQAAIDPAVKGLIGRPVSVTDILIENEQQEFDQLGRVVAAVAKLLPSARVYVWREQRVQRTPGAGTCRVIQYACEVDGETTRADGLDRLRTAVLTKLRDKATERRLERERGEWDLGNCNNDHDGMS